MVSPDSQATACLPSGRNSTYRPVQICGTGSRRSSTPEYPGSFEMDQDSIGYASSANQRTHIDQYNTARTIVLVYLACTGDWPLRTIATLLAPQQPLQPFAESPSALYLVQVDRPGSEVARRGLWQSRH